MTVLGEVWFALLESLGESAPFVVFGLMLAGLLREFVPASALQKRLGGEGMGPIFRAVGVGCLLPICSCSTIPLGLGMSRSGAKNGTVLAFMTSAPALSPVTVLLGFSLLGPKLLGSYSLAVLGGSCLLGLVGNRLFSNMHLPKESHTCTHGCCQSGRNRGSRMMAATRWAMFDLGSEVAQSLLVGLTLAAIILVFLPEELVLGWIGSAGPIAIFSVLLLALPAYTCSVPAMILAASLITKGASPGIAVAFLIAGPATNLGELNAIRVGLGSWTSAYYFAAVLLLAVVSATAIGSLDWSGSLPEPAGMADRLHHGHPHSHVHPPGISQSFGPGSLSIAAWRWPFMLIIGGLALHGFSKVVMGWFKPNTASAHHHAVEAETRTIAIDGLSISEGGSQ